MQAWEVSACAPLGLFLASQWVQAEAVSSSGCSNITCRRASPLIGPYTVLLQENPAKLYAGWGLTHTKHQACWLQRLTHLSKALEIVSFFIFHPVSLDSFLAVSTIPWASSKKAAMSQKTQCKAWILNHSSPSSHVAGATSTSISSSSPHHSHGPKQTHPQKVVRGYH